MKNPLLLSLLSVLALAHANAQAEITHYQDLKLLFNQAGKASLEDLNAAYSGRCYYNIPLDNGERGQDDATGSLLVGKLVNSPVPSVDPGQDGGPLFPAPTPVAPQPSVVAVLSTGASNMADGAHYRFDNYSAAQALQVEDYVLSQGTIKATPAVDNGKELSWSESFDEGNHIIQRTNIALRKSENYLVGHLVELSLANEKPPLNVEVYCYFYKKLN